MLKQIAPQLTDVVLGLVDCQLARANCVKGCWVPLALEVGGVSGGAFTAGVGNCNIRKTVSSG